MSKSKEISKSDVKKVEKFLHDLDLPKEEYGTISFWGHKPTWKKFKKKLRQIGMKTCSAQVYLQRAFLIGQDLIVDQNKSFGSLPTNIINIKVNRTYRGGDPKFDYKAKMIPVINSKGQIVDHYKAYPDLRFLDNDPED